MKIDEKELREVASAAAPRLDLYAGIHKAIRALMADTLVAVGRMDPDDEIEFAQVTQRVIELADFLRGHLTHENRFIHPAMEKRSPGSASRVGAEHDDHEVHLAELSQAVEALRAKPQGARTKSALALYRSLALLVADNFQHMQVEETQHNAALWDHYTDEELAALHNELVGSIPPPEMMFAMRWMVPAMNPAERTALLQDIRAHAPAPVFQAVVDTARPHLAAREWEKLAASLGIAAG